MRLSAKAPIVIRGEEITHLDADGYKHLPRAASLPDGKVLATSGGKWGASDLSGISVASVFGRTGAVVAQTGDYTPEQVGAEPYAGAPAVTSFWRSTAAGVRAWVQLVAADITDLATTLAGYLTKLNPDFTGALKQGGTTRIASGGGAWLTSVQSANLVGAGDRPVAADLTGTLQPKTPSQARSLIGAAKAPSKVDVSASTTLGAIDATAIKVTTTDVILTLSGGVDGQGWDIINPTASTGIAIPSGATLWKSIGSNVGPTTIALGGGRPIRITRIDANTWIMLGSQ